MRKTNCLVVALLAALYILAAILIVAVLPSRGGVLEAGGSALASNGPWEEPAGAGVGAELPMKADFSGFVAEMAASETPVLKAAAAHFMAEEIRGGCDIKGTKRQLSWAKDGQRRDIGICTHIRNEALILDEFIAFHWLQGVGHFTFYDDGSDDDPWAVLRKYASLGIVDYIDMRGHPGMGSFSLQKHDLNACFTDLRARHSELGLRWLVFTDIDEFVLSSTTGQLLTDLLNERYTGVACMEIARTYYGTSLHHRRPEGLITETFLLASPDYSQTMAKMIANIYPDGPFQQNATALHSVHNFEHQDVIPCRRKKDILDIRINHYVRSLEDYDIKVLTGHGKMNRYAKPLKIFWERDRNDVLSPIASDYACRVRGLIEMVKDMEKAGKIPPVPRPKPWNETHTKA